MDKYSKLRSTCHEPADVDSFYERGKSQNIDGDNEYTANIVETKEHDEMNENEDITDLDDEYMRDPVTGNKILLPESRVTPGFLLLRVLSYFHFGQIFPVNYVLKNTMTY